MDKILWYSERATGFDLQKRGVDKGWPKLWRCRLMSCKSGGRMYCVWGDSLEEIASRLDECEAEWNEKQD